MTALERSLHDSARDLRSAGAEFALVGGLAIAVRAEPRLTRDADLAVAVENDAEAERLVRALVERGYAVAATIEHEPTGRLAAVRLTRSAPPESVVTDLLFASSGIEPEIVAAAEDIDVLPRLSLPVAVVGHLIAMKLLARDDRHRPADADDLRALAEIAKPSDWTTAAEAVRLIMQRGFHRDRDLEHSLATLREVGPY